VGRELSPPTSALRYIPLALRWLRPRAAAQLHCWAAPPMSVGGTMKRASRVLPWILILYAAATLLHFAHNAEYLTQYPNLPASWSRADVYAAWFCLTALGVAGYVLYLRDHRGFGLTFLALYAGLGFGGLLHYVRAPMAHHSAMMNVTIWTEAAAAALLLMNLAALRPVTSRSMPPYNRWSGQ